MTKTQWSQIVTAGIVFLIAVLNVLGLNLPVLPLV